MNQIDLRAKTSKALLAIVFFIIVYLVLVFTAGVFVALCTALAFWIVSSHLSTWTLLIGIGILGLGLIVLFFLIKFLFKSNKVDRSGMIQIKESDEPKLFALIRDIATEIKTDFPKKIYLTSDINASVFYDSSFWSMFLPVRKNLQIGLGLVNSVTESELKAILAHEFGHFSQKSMKVGSYVYHVNQVIHNLLFDNDSYDRVVSQWADAHGLFAVFALIGVKIIQGIQAILARVYEIVNLSYMELSREMEFHADEIAASLAGSQPLSDSLQRLDFANNSFQHLLNFYGRQIADNKKTDNLYPQHSFSMRLLSDINKIKWGNGLPQVTLADEGKFNTSQVIVTDQWASHPSTADRVARLQQLGKAAVISNASAWGYFTDPVKIQKQLTKHMFEKAQFKGTPEDLSLEVFSKQYQDGIDQYSFASEFLGFYDQRDIEPFDLEHLIQIESPDSVQQLSDIFNESVLELSRQQQGLAIDISKLEQIVTHSQSINSFDYKGEKYKVKDAKALCESLKKEIEQVDTAIKEVDQRAFVYLYGLAKKQGSVLELKDAYLEYFNTKKMFESDQVQYLDLLKLCEFMQYTMDIPTIESNMAHVYVKEKGIKERLEILSKSEALAHILDTDTKAEVERYLSKSWKYFEGATYHEGTLHMMYRSVDAFYQLSHEQFFLQKKKLLEQQVGLNKVAND